MTPTDTIGDDVKLYRGDCLDVLATLDRGEVAAVITDPPYGIALRSNGQHFRGMRPIAGDESVDLGQAAIELCRSFKWPVAAFASPMKRWGGEWRQELVWDKGEAVGIGGDRKTCWKFTWEVLQVGKFPEVYGERDGAVMRYPITPANYADHPAAKPLNLMRYLVRKLTAPGDIILDPFMGSGSTGITAVREGRRFIGCEIDPTHYATALRRLTHAAGKDAGQLFSVMVGEA